MQCFWTSNAFDTIYHDILIRKLHFYGVCGVALEWFKNYLAGKYRYVSYYDMNSASRDVTCGVPQGSVLGPLLFIIYTNDLSNSVSHSNFLFGVTRQFIVHRKKPQLLKQILKNYMYTLSD